MTRNCAPGVEMTLLIRIFAVVSPAVLVDLSPGYSIWSPLTVNRVLSFSSLWSLISTTNDPYVTFRPLGMSDRRMNRIVFVLYSLFISFAVDLIHLILYFSFVMSSWCLSDFPVSGQITASAISGKRTMGVFGFDEWQHVAFAEIEKQWFAWSSVSAIMSWDKLCCLALRRTNPCDCGVITLLRGVGCPRCEFGVERGDMMCWMGICTGFWVSTLGGETVVCTLWGALFSNAFWGVNFLLTLFGFDASKIVANFLSAIACLSPTW
jgi:hypothetical protein